MKTEETSDVNMSLPFEETEEEIEVLDDPKRTVKDVVGDAERSINNKVDQIIKENDSIYETNIDIPVLREKTLKVKKIDTVLKIQIALVILWIVLTVSIYFFGYDLFEPIIPVS